MPALAPLNQRLDREPIVVTQALTRRFGDFTAVDALTLAASSTVPQDGSQSSLPG
jgi:hypothetical protein